MDSLNPFIGTVIANAFIVLFFIYHPLACLIEQLVKQRGVKQHHSEIKIRS